MDPKNSELPKISEVLSDADGWEAEFLYKHGGKNNVPLDHVRRITKGFKTLNSDLRTVFQHTLEFNYERAGRRVIRVTLQNPMLLDVYVKNATMLKPHQLMKRVLECAVEAKDLFSVMQKVSKVTRDFDSIPFRGKGSTEDQITSKSKIQAIINDITNVDDQFIGYRLKNRFTLKLKGGNLDITSVSQSHSLRRIDPHNTHHEVEFEVTDKAMKPDQIMKVLQDIVGFAYQTERFVGNQESTKILRLYFQSQTIKHNLDISKPISLSLDKAMEEIIHNYVVLTKVDGDRQLLFVVNKSVVLIDTTKMVRTAPVELSDELLEKYNNTIIDTEYVFDSDNNRQLIMAFDIVRFCGDDTRHLNLIQRFAKLREFVKDVFGYDWMPRAATKQHRKTVDTFGKYHKDELVRYTSHLNKYIEDKKFSVVPKFFIPPPGIHTREVFCMIQNIRDVFKQGLYPNIIEMDGEILSPINEPYTHTIRRERYHHYKLKPPHLNTIDVWMVFACSQGNTPKIISEGGLCYFVANLFVGKQQGGREFPVPLLREKLMDEAWILLDDKGVPRDLENRIIKSNTVIEVTYDPSTSIDAPKRFAVLRTRHDKTYFVRSHKMKYGNNVVVAEKVIQTIMNPLRDSDIVQLSSSKDYETARLSILERVGKHESTTEKASHTPVTDTQPFKSTQPAHPTQPAQANYYARSTELAKEMRTFHNFGIKIPLIERYVRTVGKPGAVVLDLGVGNAADAEKYARAGSRIVVGVDLYTNERIKSVLVRSKRNKESQLVHIIANPSTPFSQQKGKDISKWLCGANPIFDSAFAWFSAHYNWGTEANVKNFVTNLGVLKPGGTFVMTCFDAEKVFALLESNKGDADFKYLNHATGEMDTIFRIKRVYNSRRTFARMKTGCGIDVHIRGFMEEGHFEREFLIPDHHLKQTMKKHGFVLVESNAFGDMHNVKVVERLMKQETNQTVSRKYQEMLVFYDKTRTDAELDESRAFSNLFRYYVFKKK